MTKLADPAPVRGDDAVEVEIDAMDVAEWESGQRTPQASDAKVAELVRKTVTATGPSPTVARPPTVPGSPARQTAERRAIGSAPAPARDALPPIAPPAAVSFGQEVTVVLPQPPPRAAATGPMGAVALPPVGIPEPRWPVMAEASQPRAAKPVAPAVAPPPTRQMRSASQPSVPSVAVSPMSPISPIPPISGDASEPRWPVMAEASQSRAPQPTPPVTRSLRPASQPPGSAPSTAGQPPSLARAGSAPGIAESARSVRPDRPDRGDASQPRWPAMAEASQPRAPRPTPPAVATPSPPAVATPSPPVGPSPAVPPPALPRAGSVPGTAEPEPARTQRGDASQPRWPAMADASQSRASQPAPGGTQPLPQQPGPGDAPRSDIAEASQARETQPWTVGMQPLPRAPGQSGFGDAPRGEPEPRWSVLAEASQPRAPIAPPQAAIAVQRPAQNSAATRASTSAATVTESAAARWPGRPEASQARAEAGLSRAEQSDTDSIADSVPDIRIRGSRRRWWIAGTIAGGALALSAVAATFLSSEPPAPSAPLTRVQAAVSEAPAPHPGASAAEPSPPAVSDATAVPAGPSSGSSGSSGPAPASAGTAVPAAAAAHEDATAQPVQAAAALPARSGAASPSRRMPKLVVDYRLQPNEAAAPGLEAHGEEDPAVAKARAAYTLGNQKLFSGDAEGAIASYNKALELYPGYVGGYRGLGLAYAQRGDTANALKALRSYAAAVPGARDIALIKKRIAHLQGK